MAMDVFDFSFHQVAVDYPERSAQVKLGGNYVFSTAPAGPAMRTFTLTFPVLYWLKNASGTIDANIQPEINIARLDAFYLKHELHKNFIYNHEFYGNMVVKFSKPLRIPTAKTDSNGAVMGVSLTLIEQPL